MFDRLKSLLSPDSDGAASRGRSIDDLQLAAACLLVEAAYQDAEFDAAERTMVEKLVRARFGLDAAEADALIAAADAAVADSVEFYGFTRRIKDAFDHDQRVGMVEMLWQVVYADGTLTDREANLLRRVTALLYVTDQESGEARKRVLQKDRGVS
jgi:uncharacterized tellurite resistance protein B-like protein